MAQDPGWEKKLNSALSAADGYFVKTSSLHQAARALARHLSEEGIPYAIGGALALAAHGYERFTTDVDLLLTRDGLVRFKQAFLGRGYVEKFAGSKGMRDTAHGILIDVLLTGDYPGDGQPKPVRFPDPAAVSILRGDEYRVLPLEMLVELKIASGMSAPHRLKDLADVLELIRRAQLPLDLEQRLDPYVREKFRELWHAAQVDEPE